MFGGMNMKKVFCFLLVLALTAGLLGMTALADGAADITVAVTISVAGEIVTAADGGKVAGRSVTASDLDGSGVIDVNEVLIAAHDAFYPGGAAAGYASSESDWGLTMDMLWGDTSYAFGYYVNNAMAWGLADPVSDGGCVNAYVYADKEFYSDVYAYFDKAEAKAENGAVTLTLYAGSFDENWNVVFAPCAGATVTVNGERSEFVTDENGRVTVTFPAAGGYLLSAVSDDVSLVPTACTVTADSGAALTASLIAPAGQTYTVAPGDYLWKIAQKFYGTGYKWDVIYKANAGSIRNPNLIYAGQVLVIPE